MKEERLKKKSEGVSEVLEWVGNFRKLEEKRNAEKEKALQRSKIFEEQVVSFVEYFISSQKFHLFASDIYDIYN